MFTTKVKIPQAEFQIDYHTRTLAMGSCFAENIAIKLQKNKFLNFLNPFGVLYNPMSVAQSLDMLLDDKEFGADDLFRNGSLWSSFSHSTLFSGETAEETLQNINSTLLAARYFLKETDLLMITLGTAWVFELKETGKVVSNCHKLPADNFTRRRLSVEEIVQALNEQFGRLTQLRPDLKILLTVSPIRHQKDGAHENTISKSTLHLAVAELMRTHDRISYFPAYEIMLDELRDYRFYASDMLHPSDVAVDYIWQQFATTYFSPKTRELQSKLSKLRTDLDHRPLHGDTAEYRAFLDGVEARKLQLIREYPFLKERFE